MVQSFPQCLVVGLENLCRKTDRGLLIFSHMDWKKGVTHSWLSIRMSIVAGDALWLVERFPGTASTGHDIDLQSQISEIEEGA